jgi:hypothetical protein
MVAPGRLAAVRQDCSSIPGRVLQQSVAVDLRICSILEGRVLAVEPRKSWPLAGTVAGGRDDPNLGDWFL